MHVKIKDCDPFKPIGGLGVQCPDSHVIEEAEAHGARRFGMVPGWADQAKGAGKIIGHNSVYGVNNSAGRFEGSFR